MSGGGIDWAVTGLRTPERLQGLTPVQWTDLVRQARLAGVLARIGAFLDRQGLLPTVPPVVQGYIRAEQLRAAAQHEEVRHEIAAVREALRPLGLPVMLLKGAAYVALGLPASIGRSFSDVDLLVPKHRLDAVESALMQRGWMTTHHSPYDQRYYREWMHELPPLRHVRRHSVLDVHHTLLPQTARSRLDPALLFAGARAVPGWDGVQALAPEDLVLHSMTHLFHNDDLSRGLRDLSDLDLLLRELAIDGLWWHALIDRAQALDILRPLYYGLACTRRILGTPIPDSILAACRRAAALSGVADASMAKLWSRALSSQHGTAVDAWTPVALFLLYLRAHWLRMPPVMLVRHLAVKAVMRLVPEPEEA